MFAVCALPIFLWAFYSFLYAFPGFVLQLSVWDLIGTLSYTLAFALIESLVVSIPFLLLAILLPAWLFKDRMVVLTALIIGISSLWMIYANYHLINLAEVDFIPTLPSLALYLLSLALPITLVLRSTRVERFVQAVVQRVAVLVYVYAALASVGVVIIIIRNI